MTPKLFAVRLYDECRHTWYGILFIDFVKYLLSRDLFHTKLKVRNRGSLRLKKWVIGRNNIMNIGEKACLNKVTLKIQGSNNVISIGSNTVIGKGCCIYLFGNNLELSIGNGCTFSHDDELLVQEDNSKLIIGDDCMFSHHINVRTSDAHSVYDANTKKRCNEAKDIVIGNHVWVTAYCIIQKGCNIGDGCIVATHSVVNQKIAPYKSAINFPSYDPARTLAPSKGCPYHAIIAGQPAKVVKENIIWDRKL